MSQSQTIRRKGSSARKTAAQQGKARKVQARKARTGSALDSIMAWLPFTEEQLHRLFIGAILFMALLLAGYLASLAGVFAFARSQFAIAAADLGFSVHRVEVRGAKHINELKIYERVLAERNQPMPEVDIERLREELLELSWVEDARVSRQLPETLVIDVVERTPHAVLRKPNRLVLIDGTGHELEPVSAERARGKLMISGPGAYRQVEALTTLLSAAPALKPQVAEAEWIGNRRWNLTFKTGQVLALPEGEDSSGKALVSFARLDGTNRLLGGKVLAFDMRAADRIYLRIPGRAEAQRLEMASPAPKRAETDQ
jgi:cell division protein FtsQ